MKTIYIPDNRHNFSIDVELDGSEYSLLFTYNSRVSKWYVRVSDSTGEVVLGDRRITGNRVLFYVNKRSDLPPGRLAFVMSDRKDPTLRRLAIDTVMVYFQEDDLV